MKYFILVAALVTICYGATVEHFWREPRAEGTCVGRCGAEDSSFTCQCNNVCSDFGDCCPDYSTICFTCLGRCGEEFSFSLDCVCSDGCEDFNDCCVDYAEICGGTTGNPVERSCEGNCNDGYDPALSCQCNSECGDFGNCCPDYSDFCSSGGGSATAQDVKDFTEQVFAIGQVDYVGTYIVIDSVPPGPLFVSVDEAQAFASDTMQTFITLRPYYDSDTCIADDQSPEYEAAKNAFLDAVMLTDTMNITDTFVHDYGLLATSVTLRDYIDNIFFDFYTRCGSTEGSNGFEHSFLGEIDESQVKGFHNWVSFYLEEQAGNLVYTEFLDEQNISPELDLFMMGFDWLSYNKPISSMWIGSTPEMELSLYVVSFLFNHNSLVDVSMNGVAYKIQTYDQSYNGDILVGSAYPDII